MSSLPSLQKRRSARNTKRKKYLDELDLDLSEEDTTNKPDGAAFIPVIKQTVNNVQFFVVSMP